MSKVIIIILIISSLFLAGLSITAILLTQNSSPFRIALRTTPTPTITSLHSLTLSPSFAIVRQGQINTIDVIIETQTNTTNRPRLVQMEIAYNPNALFDVEISPGDFFTHPTVILKTVNTNTGRISYALERSANEANEKTTGVAAKITFIPNPAFAGIETPLSFLGKTIIRGTTDTDILTATYGTRLFFATASATPN